MSAAMFDTQTLARFWAKVDRAGGPDACWPWTAATRDGYGMFWTGREMVGAHRVAWQIEHGRPVPPGVVVRHHVCDSPPCANAVHLRAGTHGDNMDDMTRRGRQSRGTGRPSAVLTEADVVAIRHAYASGGVTYRDIANEYRVSSGLIGFVVRGELWMHLPGPRTFRKRG